MKKRMSIITAGLSIALFISMSITSLAYEKVEDDFSRDVISTQLESENYDETIRLYDIPSEDFNVLEENKNQIDTIYANIYAQCQNQKVTQITDEYSAYSYLLNNKKFVTLNQGKIRIDTEAMEIDGQQLDILNAFIGKIDNLVDLNVIKVNSDLSFSMLTAPETTSSPVVMAITIDLMTECRSHAAEIRTVYDNAPFGTVTIVAGTYFAERVKGGGVWDYKNWLGLNTRYYETELRATMTGETIGNFHYGYVGSELFSPSTLKSAAGLVQITSGTAKAEWFSSYFDDPKDQENIQWGIDVYKRNN